MPSKSGAPKKQLGGAAKKAAAAAEKEANKASHAAAAEDAEWSKGAQGTSKKEAAEAKKRAAADRKKTAAAALAEEEASLPSKPKGPPGSSFKATKRTRGGIDAALNASGLDDALDALDITVGGGGGGAPGTGGIDRHPERRYKVAYAAYEERRLPEVRQENKGLRLGQMKELIRKEFEKSPENPFNQGLNVKFDATKEEVEAAKAKQREEIEERLAEK